MYLDKAVLAWGGRAEEHRKLCSWLRAQGPVIILHVINSETDEVFLALVQNYVYVSGAREAGFQKVWESSVNQMLSSDTVAVEKI